MSSRSLEAPEVFQGQERAYGGFEACAEGDTPPHSNFGGGLCLYRRYLCLFLGTVSLEQRDLGPQGHLKVSDYFQSEVKGWAGRDRAASGRDGLSLN